MIFSHLILKLSLLSDVDVRLTAGIRTNSGIWHRDLRLIAGPSRTQNYFLKD